MEFVFTWKPTLNWREVNKITYRIKYSKKGIARYTSHLDVLRVLTRTLRRTGLPLAYSVGFHPKPILSFGPPLPLGVESVAEYFDLELTRTLAEEEVELALKQQLPPGMEVIAVQKLAPKSPSLMAAADSISYQFMLRRKCPLPDGQVEEWFAALWSRPELLVTKKTKQGQKPVNIRPLWKAYKLSFQPDGLILFDFEVAFGPQGTIRPDDFDSLLVAAFQIEQRRRTAVNFKTGERHRKVL